MGDETPDSSRADHIHIRRATSANAGHIVALLAEQLAEHEIMIDQAQLRTAVERVLSEPDRLGWFLLACDVPDQVHPHPVGVAYVALIQSLEHAGMCAWLEELYVEPAYRNRGIGSALIKQVILTARKAGCTAIDLEVDTGHSEAERLYERHGFEPLSRRRWVLRSIR